MTILKTIIFNKKLIKNYKNYLAKNKILKFISKKHKNNKMINKIYNIINNNKLKLK